MLINEKRKIKDNSTIEQPLLHSCLHIVLLQLCLRWLILQTKSGFQIISS